MRVWIIATVSIVLGAFLLALVMLLPARDTGTRQASVSSNQLVDYGRIPGQDLMAQAEQKLNRGDSVAASQLYEEARKVFQQQSDRLGEARAVFGLGRMEHYTGQSDNARTRYADSLELLSDEANILWQARVLAAMGDLEKDTFNWAEAASFYRRAREVWDSAPGPKSDPHVMLNLSAAPAMPAGEEAAWAALEQAELIFHNASDHFGLGEVRMLSGMLQKNLELPLPARTNFVDAAAKFRISEDSRHEAEALMEIASIDVSRGFNVAAEESLSTAASLLDGQGGHNDIRIELLRGDLERLQGRLEIAHRHYSAAAERNGGSVIAADALLRIGEVLIALDDTSAASASISQSIAIYRDLNLSGPSSHAALSLATLASSAGKHGAAESHLLLAREGFRQGDDALGEGRALLQLADLAFAQGNFSASLEFCSDAAERFEYGAVPFGQVLTHLTRGDVERAAGGSGANAYRTAISVAATMDHPVAEANRLLFLPPVNTIRAAPSEAVEDYGEGDGPPGQDVVPELAPIEAANLAVFPNHNLEARALWAATEARLSAVTEIAGIQPIR